MKYILNKQEKKNQNKENSISKKENFVKVKIRGSFIYKNISNFEILHFFLKISVMFTFYILHYTKLEHFCGHCGTLPRLRGPSWTFMDPKMDPARLNSGDPP